MDRHDEKLIAYYNKFPEEKRLNSRHGQVEYLVTRHFIDRYLDRLSRESAADCEAASHRICGAGTARPVRVLDIGAGTGRYAVPLAEEGCEVTAVEFVKYNVGMLKKKHSAVRALSGDARDLAKAGLGQDCDGSFDLTLLLGPMYHLISDDDKERALAEAVRLTRPGGYILVGYLMNEYSVLTYGFRQHHILGMRDSLHQVMTRCGTDERQVRDRSGTGLHRVMTRCGADDGAVQIGEFRDHASYGGVDESFHVRPAAEDLYDYVRLEDIDRFTKRLSDAGLVRRETIFSPDGPANYMRRELNALSEEEFRAFVDYQLAVCERGDLLGAGGHLVDVLSRR